VVDGFDVERLYSNVLELQGMRSHLFNQENLDKTADKINEKMENIGLDVYEHTFTVNGTNTIFRNIVGTCGDVDNNEAIVIVAHYDGANYSPAANDNAASIAAMLEVACQLIKHENPPAVYFLACTLEEGSPETRGQEMKNAIKFNIMDSNLIYTSLQNMKYCKLINSEVRNIYSISGEEISKVYERTKKKYDDVLSEDLKAYLNENAKLFQGLNIYNMNEKDVCVGSTKWLADTLKAGKRIKCCIALDEMGIASDKEESQAPFSPEEISMIKSHKVDFERCVGNFEAVISTDNSKALGNAFIESCKIKDIDLPYAWFDLPGNFDWCVQNFSAGLSSDHFAFVKNNIPSIFVTDTSYMRAVFLHTRADTIDKVNFDHLLKVTKAIYYTVVTIK